MSIMSQIADALALMADVMLFSFSIKELDMS